MPNVAPDSGSGTSVKVTKSVASVIPRGAAGKDDAPSSSIRSIALSGTRDLISIAETQIGYEGGWDSSQGLPTSDFGAYYGSRTANWCAFFVSWCVDQLGLPASICPQSGSVSVLWDEFKELGKFSYKEAYTPQRNDILIMKSGGRSHTGIIEYVEDGYVHTIEGNASNSVRRRAYPLMFGQITGYGRVHDYIQNLGQVSGQIAGATAPAQTNGTAGAIATGGQTSIGAGIPRATNNTPISTVNSSDAQKTAQIEAEYKYLTDYLKAHGDKTSTTEPEEIELSVKKSGVKTKVRIEMLVHNSTGHFQVPVLDPVTVTWERKCTPGKLEFTTITSKKNPIVPGNEVRFSVDGRVFFYGFCFQTTKAQDKTVRVVCYDQLRYFKAKDTYVCKGTTATEEIRDLGKAIGANVGKLADTGYKLDRVEDGTCMLDMIQNALDETLYYTGNIFTLFDQAGTLRLKSPSQMKCSCLLDSETGQAYTYTASIDGETYNKIKLVYTNEQTGERVEYAAQDGKTINRWGTLQYYDTVPAEKLAPVKARVLLSLYDRMSRTLALTDFFGDVSVRAGSLVPVLLKLDDMSIKNYMMVDKVTHRFENGLHTMTLNVSGAGFDATT